MTKPIKFTDVEIKKINDLRLEVSGVFTQLGQIQIEKTRRLEPLLEEEDKLKTKHSELVVTEQDLFKTLNDKYGDGNYNPETGEFTPIEVQKEQKEQEADASNV